MYTALLELLFVMLVSQSQERRGELYISQWDDVLTLWLLLDDVMLIAGDVVQPFDAAAAVMDGGLLGASETAYASRATLVVAGCVYGLLSVVPRAYPGLFGVWLSLKGLSVGRTLAASFRLASARSPLSRETGGTSLAPTQAAAEGEAASAGQGHVDGVIRQEAASDAGVVLASQQSLEPQDGVLGGDEVSSSGVSSNIVAGKKLREQESSEVASEKL